jgi:hypothetical protein
VEIVSAAFDELVRLVRVQDGIDFDLEAHGVVVRVSDGYCVSGAHRHVGDVAPERGQAG